MNTAFCAHEHVHLLGDCATRPIEQRYGALAALLLLAGMSPQRPAQAKRRARLRMALPAHRIAARSSAFNCAI